MPETYLGRKLDILPSELRGAAKFVNAKMGERALVVAEIGVQRARNATAMLRGMNISRLYLIDAYTPYKDNSFVFPQDTQDWVYACMFKSIQPFISKTTLISKDSIFASRIFDDGFFDFVYIDGWHQYPQVKRDTDAWWPKVKVGGVLGGHDIGHVEFPGVAKAVEQFSKKIGKPYQVVGDSDWVIEKD